MWLCLSLKRQGKCRVNIDELKLNFMDSKVSSLILRREKLIKLPTVRLSDASYFQTEMTVHVEDEFLFRRGIWAHFQRRAWRFWWLARCIWYIGTLVISSLDHLFSCFRTQLQLAAIRQQKLRAKLKQMYDAHHSLREEEARQTKADAVLLFNYYSASELNLVRRFVQQGARGFHRTRTRSWRTGGVY